MKGLTNAVLKSVLNDLITLYELVTIIVRDSNGNILDSNNVKIKEKFGNKIPYGETYTVIANPIGGYIIPKPQTYIANLYLRIVEVVYLTKLMGVFIEDIDGNLYTEALWDDSKTANGIAVVTDNCEFVMALEDAHIHACWWGSYGTTVSGITTVTNKTEAQADYDGEEQTSIILDELGNSSSTSDAPAAYYCHVFTFPNGKKGYLGAAGEWLAALDNKAAIKSAMRKCGGSMMNDYYWTSTQYNSTNSWCMDWDVEDLVIHSKDTSTSVRVFTTLKSMKSINTIIMTIDDNRKLNIIMDYPATSLLKLECSQDGGVTWTEYGPTIAIGNTNFSENYYHPLTGVQYRLNILEDDTYIYQFRVVDTRLS